MPKTTKNTLKEWGKWKHLKEITMAWALELINKKSEKEIGTIINLSKAEIKAMVDNFNIKEHETLVCQIQGGVKLTEREEEFLTLIKQGKNISEISRIIVVNLIERINIFENAEIEVVFRQRDQFADIMSFLEQQEQKKAAKGAIPFPGLEVV